MLRETLLRHRKIVTAVEYSIKQGATIQDREIVSVIIAALRDYVNQLDQRLLGEKKYQKTWRDYQ